MIIKELQAKIDCFLDKNALLIIVLSYLFMPYPPKSGYFTFSAIIVFALGIYILFRKKEIRVDKAVFVLIALFAVNDFLFIFRKGFSFSIFRAYAFGLLTFVSVMSFSNKESIGRLLKGLLLWVVLTFILVIAQLIAGDFFYVPHYFGYYWGFKTESLFNFFRITTPLGFNFSKTQLGGQLSFIIPFLICMSMAQYHKGMVKWYHITLSAAILGFSFSRAALVGVIFAVLLPLFIFRYREYLKKLLIFLLFLCLSIFAVSLDKRVHKAGELSSQHQAAPVYKGNVVVKQNLDVAPVPVYKGNVIVKQNLNVTSDVSVRTRFVLIFSGMNIIREYPFGGGPGFFKEKYGELRSSVIDKINPRLNIAPHNTYIQILVEKGIPGFLIFIFLTGLIILRLYNESRSSGDALLQGVFVSFISLLIYGFFHEILPDRMFWIALGLAVIDSGKFIPSLPERTTENKGE